LSQASRATAPVQRTQVGEVHAGLRRLLGSGEFGLGDRLPSEKALQHRFGVSRNVVREALARLRAEGRIVVRKGSGSYLSEPGDSTILPAPPIASLDDLLRRHDLRTAIECEAAYLAADRWTRDTLAGIARAGRVLSEQLARGDPAGKEDFLFHSAVAAATHNDVLLQAFQALFSQIRDWIALSLNLRLVTPEQRLAIVDEEHAAIHDAITRRQPEEAARAMRRHLQHGRDRFLRGVAE
jgi:GntR family transcriptional regulator, transcriptional repressor for pyruvate dehydrogenase complex